MQKEIKKARLSVNGIVKADANIVVDRKNDMLYVNVYNWLTGSSLVCEVTIEGIVVRYCSFSQRSLEALEKKIVEQFRNEFFV